jgi:hypothetical protein
MELNLEIIGYILILLALGHVIFPHYFNWADELRQVSLINRQLMYVHTFFIGLVLMLMGLLCITSANEIISTALGRRIALGLGVFWLARLFIQFFVYSPELWKNKLRETLIHVVFVLLWTYLSAMFLWVYFYQQ